MVDAYWRHEEWKSGDPAGGPCQPDTAGLLPRRPVGVAGLVPIGKEAAFVEEAEEGLVEPDDLLMTYRAGGEERARWDEVVARLRGLSTAALKAVARQLGIAERNLWRYRDGLIPRAANRVLLLRWCKHVRVGPDSPCESRDPANGSLSTTTKRRTQAHY